MLKWPLHLLLLLLLLLFPLLPLIVETPTLTSIRRKSQRPSLGDREDVIPKKGIDDNPQEGPSQNPDPMSTWTVRQHSALFSLLLL